MNQKEQTATQNRFEWIDQAKGIGIVLVVFGHVIGGIHSAKIPIDPGVFNWTWDILYSFHMPLFFFLSGLFFIPSFQSKGMAGVITSKVDTLVYPYLLWSLLQGMLQLLASQYVNNPVTLGEIFSLLWRPRQEFWFLYALFFTYLIACIVATLTQSQRRLSILFIVSIALFLLRSEFSNIAALGYPSWYLIYFTVGCVPWVIYKLTNYPMMSLVSGIGMFVLTTVLMHNTSSDGIVFPLYYLSVAFSGITMVIGASVLLARSGISAMAFLGRHSLQIYLLHTTVVAAIRVFLIKLFHVTNLPIHLALEVTIGISIPLAMAVAVEKYNMRWLFASAVCAKLRRYWSSYGESSPGYLAENQKFYH